MELDSKSVHRNLGRWILASGYDMVLDIERSQGLRLYDSRRERWMLDFFGFFASSALGMNHPALKSAEFLRRLQRVSVNKLANSDVYTEEYAEFVDTVAKLARPKGMEHMFFVDGGTLGVENALKAAFDWKVRKNLEDGKGPKGSMVMHLKDAFHGRSGYTLSLTNTFDPRKTEFYPKFDWPRITNPKITFPLEENVERVKKLEETSLEEAERAVKKNGDEIAAFIMEPIQGEGGDNHFRKEYFQRMKAFAEANDMMFIVDEVQTGVGATGRMWCYQHYGIEPDMLVFGKKLQVSGMMVGRKIDEVRENVFRVPSRINSTFGGNLTDMVRASKILETIKKERLERNAARMGSLLLKGLKEMQEKGRIENTRGLGLIIAFDLKSTKERDRVFASLYKNGLLTLKTGEKGIRFRPPLVIGKREADAALGILERTIK